MVNIQKVILFIFNFLNLIKLKILNPFKKDGRLSNASKKYRDAE